MHGLHCLLGISKGWCAYGWCARDARALGPAPYGKEKAMLCGLSTTLRENELGGMTKLQPESRLGISLVAVEA
jgi:hypothetical protein